jgi:hypothetical protein
MDNKIKHSYLKLLIYLLSFSFGSYVVLSPFKVNHAITINDFDGEKTETAKESTKEIVDIDIEQRITLFFLPSPKVERGTEKIKKLLPAINSPNTPPPDLSA